MQLANPLIFLLVGWAIGLAPGFEPAGASTTRGRRTELSLSLVSERPK
jgi:hypothetical protein